MNIGIVGLGLIGGTYAKSLKGYNHKILAIDKDQDTIDYALKNKIIDEGSIDPYYILPKCDVVYLCLYPELTVSFTKKYMGFFKNNAILSDTCGIKRSVIKGIEPFLREDIDFIFAHPIAGREKIGIKYSDASIFKNANYIITPTIRNKKENIDLIEELARQMGFKNITNLSDIEHDNIIAYTSQLTHLIALSLVTSDDLNFDKSLFIGDSYKDLTRIAMINESLWTELFIKNKDFLINKLDDFTRQINTYKKLLETEDIDELKKLMKESTKRRKKIEQVK